MASFTLRAYPAWHYRDSLGGSTISRPMETVGAAQKIEARSVAVIADAVGTFGKQIRVAHPGTSFTVAVIISRGNRKPNGFDVAYLGNGFGQDAWLDLRDREGRPLATAISQTDASAPTCRG